MVLFDASLSRSKFWTCTIGLSFVLYGIFFLAETEPCKLIHGQEAKLISICGQYASLFALIASLVVPTGMQQTVD